MSFFYSPKNRDSKAKASVLVPTRQFEPDDKYPAKEWKVVNEDPHDEYDTDEDGDLVFSSQEVSRVCRQIERHRDEIANAEDQLWRWAQSSPKFKQFWNRFQSAGGVTATDWDNFVKGTMRHRRVTKKKHLRMVINRKAVRQSQPSRSDDAA